MRTGVEIRPLCYGTFAETGMCSACNVKAGCINCMTSSEEGTLMLHLEEYTILYETAKKGLSEEEVALLDDLIEAGGYTASTEDDCFMLGRIPDQVQLAAEATMESKMKKFMEQVSTESPNVWWAYAMIIRGLDNNRPDLS